MVPSEKPSSGFVGKAKIVAAATFLSRLLAVVRESAFAHVFGAESVMDSWALAFMIPNLFRRLFGEGALSAAFIPVYSEAMASEDKQLAQRLARATLWLLVVILAAIVLVGEGIILSLSLFFGDNPKTALTLVLAAIVLPYVILICLVALIGGILNARYHFSCPALAPVILNIFMIVAAVWLTGLLGGDPSEQIFALCVGVLVGGLAQLVLVLLPLKRMGVSLAWLWKPQMEQIRRILKLTAPMVLGLGVLQINTLMDYLWVTWLTGPLGQPMLIFGSWIIRYPVTDGAVSVLYYSQRLYNVPLGVFGIALATAIFPYFTACAARNDHAGLIETLVRGLRQVAFIGLAASVGLIIISRPAVEFILGGGLSAIFGIGPGQFDASDIHRVSATLSFYCLGIWAYCGVHVVVRGFYALQDTITPVRIGVRIVLLNIPLNLILIWPLGTGGLALSTAICAALNLAILTRLLNKRIQSFAQTDQAVPSAPLAEVAACLPRILLATALMAAAAFGALRLAEHLVGPSVAYSGIRLAAALFAGVLVYYLAAKFLKCREIPELLSRGS